MGAATNSCFHCDIRPRTFYVLLAACWLLLSLSFIATLPSKNFFGHDTGAHIEYTRYIRAEKKLPGPWHGWQTYQPPAYYLINQLLAPRSQHHVKIVRLSSVLYGFLFLLACHAVMRLWNIPRSAQLLVLMYFMSMPAFLYLFTAYNNDALAMSIAAGVTACALACYHKPGIPLMALLFVLATLGIYTKYSLVLEYAAIGIVLGAGLLVRRIQCKKALIILVPLFAGCMLLIPYMRFHNFAYTGKYMPSNYTISGEHPWNIQHDPGLLRFFLSPPALTNGEWTQPYAFDVNFHATLEPIPFYWTKKTFLSSILSTSLFGEFNYSVHVPSADTWAWIALWAYIAVLASLCYFNKANQALTVFLLGSLFMFGLFIAFSHHAFNSVNFRLCAWINVPLSVLAASELARRMTEKRFRAAALLAGAMVIGIFSHGMYQFTLNAALP